MYGEALWGHFGDVNCKTWCKILWNIFHKSNWALKSEEDIMCVWFVVWSPLGLQKQAGPFLRPSHFWRFIVSIIEFGPSYFKVNLIPEERDGVRILQGHFWCRSFGAAEFLTSQRQVQFLRLSGAHRFFIFLNTCETDISRERCFLTFLVLSKGHSFLRPYLSVSNGPPVIPARSQLQMGHWAGR